MKAFFLYPLLFLPVLLFGQNEPLSLQDAIDRTLSQNFDIQVEQKRIERAENNNNWGDAGRFPSIAIEIQQGNSLSNIENPAGFLTGDILNNNIQPALVANWRLFGGGQVKYNKARLQALENETAGNADIIIENAVQNLIKTYYQVTLEWERLRVAKRILTFSQDRYAYVQVQKDLGTAVSAELMLEETNFLTDSAAYVTQKLNYENALRNLNQIMGETDIEAKYDLIDSLDAQPTNYELSSLQTQMLISNANLYRQYLTQLVFKEATRLAEANQYPTVDLNLRASQNRNRQDLSSAVLANGGQLEEPVNTAITTAYSGTFGLNFVIFNGGQIKRAIQRARIDEDIARLQFEGVQQSLVRDLANLYATYNAQKELLKIAERTQAAAKRNFEISQERFRVGTINSFDVRIVQNNYLNAATAALQAEYNLIATET
ncbi:MAG: TolC family protein, partial [Bacteroidota bacterium]